MPSIEITRFARGDLAQLIETRHLPADTRERVSRSLFILREFRGPASASQASGETAAG